MTDFDDRFAEHVRTVFDAYHEPVDPAALARLRAELGHAPAPGLAVAPDRAAARRQRDVRWRALAALAVLLVAAGGGWLAVRGTDRTQPVEIAGAEPAASGRPAEAPQTPASDGADASAESGGEPRPALAARAEPSGASAARSVAGRPGSDGPASAVVRRDDTNLGEPGRQAVEVPGHVAPDVPPAPGPTVLLALAPLPPTAAAGVPDGLGAVPVPASRVDLRAPDTSGRSGVRVVVATTSAFAAGQRAEGAGVSAGVSRDWRLGRGLTLSGGAAATYNRFAFDPDGVTADQAFADAEQDPAVPVDVTTQSTLSTLAVEVPLDLAVDLARTRRGRLSASAGLTSALYLAQTFEDQGQRVVGERFTGASGDSRVALSSAPFEARETAGALGRLDLARQLNLGLGFATAGPRPLAVDVYTRLPLGGLTSRDLALTTVGVRLRVALP